MDILPHHYKNAILPLPFLRIFRPGLSKMLFLVFSFQQKLLHCCSKLFCKKHCQNYYLFNTMKVEGYQLNKMCDVCTSSYLYGSHLNQLYQHTNFDHLGGAFVTKIQCQREWTHKYCHALIQPVPEYNREGKMSCVFIEKPTVKVEVAYRIQP